MNKIKLVIVNMENQTKNLKKSSQDLNANTEIDDEKEMDAVSENSKIFDQIVNFNQAEHWFKFEVCVYKCKQKKNIQKTHDSQTQE